MKRETWKEDKGKAATRVLREGKSKWPFPEGCTAPCNAVNQRLLASRLTKEKESVGCLPRASENNPMLPTF